MENTTTSQTDSGGSDTTLITEQVKQGAQQVAQQTQQVMGQVAEGTQQAVSQAAEGAKRQAQSFAEQRKGQATATLHQVHTALSQTSQNLRDQNQSAAAGLIDSATGKLQGVCEYLESRGTGEILADLENVARSNTPLFLGGAFALGILAARFLKSSTPRRPSMSGAGGGRYYPGPYSGQYSTEQYTTTGQYPTGQYSTGQYPGGQYSSGEYPTDSYSEIDDYTTSARQSTGGRRSRQRSTRTRSI